jgi:hypothetical protein
MAYEYDLTMTLLRKILGTKKNAGNIGYLCNAKFIYADHQVL